MVRREVERAEVVPLRLGFRAGRDRKAELAKDALDLLDDERDGVLCAAPLPARGHRRIGELAGRRTRCRQLELTRFIRVRDLLLRRVELPSRARSIVLGELA